MTGSILNGLESVLPIWSEPPLILDNCKNCEMRFEPFCGNDKKIKMPDGNNVRQYMVKVMSTFQDRLLKNAEADTDSLLNLILVINISAINFYILYVFKYVYELEKKINK